MAKSILFPLVLLSLVLWIGCTTSSKDACGVPISLKMADAATGEAIAGAKVVAKNADFPEDISAVEWDASKKLYKIAGRSGTYTVHIEHAEYPDILLDSIKLEDYDGSDGGSMTQSILLEVRKVSDPNPGGAPPFEIKRMTLAPPHCE